LESQKTNTEENNEKIISFVKKWKGQNMQLKKDLANRTAYYKTEVRVRAEFEKAMEKIIEIMEQKCPKTRLLEEVYAAKAHCESFTTANSSPALAGSDVSDF
jgi:hypothetical protein